MTGPINHNLAAPENKERYRLEKVKYQASVYAYRLSKAHITKREMERSKINMEIAKLPDGLQSEMFSWFSYYQEKMTRRVAPAKVKKQKKQVPDWVKAKIQRERKRTYKRALNE